MVRILTHICFYLFLITLSSTAIAEDMLIKGEAKYLGKRIGKDDFRECKGSIIKIGKGRVEKTDEKCGENGPPGPSVADSDAVDGVETGRLLAILLDAGRVTIGVNQELINDPAKGDKGFTPEVFEKQLTEQFKERSGVDLGKLKDANVPEVAKKLLPQLVSASKAVVAENQPIINKQGVGFKGFIPATFGTQAAAKFSTNSGIYLKQITNDGLLRTPKNKADDFVQAVLKKFADPSYPRQGDKIITGTVEGGKTLRVLLPLFDGKGCTPCHAAKGKEDISGYIKEGDLGGAISVELPIK
jgi:general secretion pathway protein A